MKFKLLFISYFILYISSIYGAKCPCLPLQFCPSVKPPQWVPLTEEVKNAIDKLRCIGKGPRWGLQVTCCSNRQTKLPNRLPEKCGIVKAVNNKIFGGNETALGSHPWAAALFYRKTRWGELELNCGGTLITDLHVLTAAHCRPDQVVHLRLGEWNQRTDPDCYTTGLGEEVCAPPAILRLVAHASVHPLYNTNSKEKYDAAVIRLDKPVTFTAYVQPLCLPTLEDPLPTKAKAIGWGFINKYNDRADILKEVQLPLVDVVTCNIFWQGQLGDSQICAGGVFGQDSCGGDSGGGLVAVGKFGPPFSVIGITSFGNKCGEKYQYGVYTSVAKIRDWIIETLEK